MKRVMRVALIVAFMVGLATSGWATSYTGSITASEGNLIASGVWDESALLEWLVDDETNEGFWTYQYTFTVDEKELSHALIEVSENTTLENFNRDLGTPFDDELLDTYSPTDPSNPGLPGSIFAIKFEEGGGLITSWTIVTDRMPMWGDFYAKDGRIEGTLDHLYAYNSAFGIDTTGAIGDNDDAHGWVLVPDTVTSVPEPSTLLLIGTGLVGIGAFRRKFKG